MPFAVIAALSLLSNLPIHPTRLFVEPRAGAAPTELANAHRALGAHVLFDLREIGWQVVELDAGRGLVETRQAYAANPLFVRADYDVARKLAHTPNDPYWPGMWHLQHMHADTAWDTTRGSSSVVIGLIDTGMETSHPDLAANVWVNPGEIPGNGIDDDGDGYIDDVNGYDFVNLDPIPDDVLGHGTSCAGLLAAVQDNSLGVTGMAPLCRVAPLKACNDSGYLYDSYVVPALLFAGNHHFQVISMSFYGDAVTPAERSAIDFCWAHGCLPVAAAGNDAQTFPYYPGAYEHTLCVGAHDGSDLKSGFSNFGSWVDLCSPGQGLSATTTGGGYTTSFAGTSGACPQVAGLAALLFSALPSATNASVRAAIEDSATTLTQAPYGIWTNYGRADANAALQRLLGLTSGSKPARFLFASPCGGGLVPVAVGTSATRPELTLYGVGLELPNVVRVLRNGVALTLSAQLRNEVRTRVRSNFSATIGLEVQGTLVHSFVWEGGDGFVYAPSDANTKDPAVTTGGFFELVRDDGSVLTATRNPSSGQIFVQLVIRRVNAVPVHGMALEWTRGWNDCAGGNESVQFYDWSTASFPYGSFVTVASGAIVNASPQHSSVNFPSNPARFLDDEGTLYAQITATNAGAAALLSMDSFRVRVW